MGLVEWVGGWTGGLRGGELGKAAELVMVLQIEIDASNFVVEKHSQPPTLIAMPVES
jgi:hypothetical protein